MPKIYTKTGDNGTTSLYDGTRLGKDYIIFNILGDIDELSTRIGLVYSLMQDMNEYKDNWKDKGLNILLILRTIQSTLQDINSNIANAKVNIDYENVTQIETYIDTMTSTLPPLTNFILSGEKVLDANIHLCRTQTRKVERGIWTINEVDEVIYKYMNRLSDFFFTLARWTLV
jgi:cob(I)alamin adenosyltransferase